MEEVVMVEGKERVVVKDKVGILNEMRLGMRTLA